MFIIPFYFFVKKINVFNNIATLNERFCSNLFIFYISLLSCINKTNYLVRNSVKKMYRQNQSVQRVSFFLYFSFF